MHHLKGTLSAPTASEALDRSHDPRQDLEVSVSDRPENAKNEGACRKFRTN